MKKRLYFDKTVKIDPVKIYVLIADGKIREYHGFNFTDSFVLSILPNPKFDKSDLGYKKVELDENFKLEKVSKYDRKKKQIKANYKIDCHELFQLTLKDIYINLNFIEKFRIDYANKQTAFHEMKFKQKIIYFLLFSIPALFIGYYLNNSGILTTKNQITSETQIDSIAKISNDLSIEIVNTPSIIFFISDSIEFDSIAKLDSSDGIYEVSSDFEYYASKIIELYKDSTLHVSYSDKRFFKFKNELIDKHEQESFFGIILADNDKYKIETGVFTDADILRLINEFYRKN